MLIIGSVIIFVGLASRWLLNKKLAWYQWTGIGVISSGILLVGASDLYSSDDTDTGRGLRQPLMGDIIIVAAQVGLKHWPSLIGRGMSRLDSHWLRVS